MINFCLNLNEKLTLLISLIGVLISGATLVLGYYAFRKVLSQKLNEKQLEVVFNLLESIYKYTFHITREYNHADGSRGRGYMEKNLFQIAKFESIEPDSQYNFRVLITISHVFRFQPWIFVSNPLLPNTIAENLKKLNQHIIHAGVDTRKVAKYMIIGEEKNEQIDGSYIAVSEFKGGFSTFIEDCKMIDKSIKEWLNKHGVSDLNQHVINTSNEDWL